MMYNAKGKIVCSQINFNRNRYNALVWPHFNYCSTIWNDGSCSIIDKLFKLQKRAARMITRDTYDVR